MDYPFLSFYRFHSFSAKKFSSVIEPIWFFIFYLLNLLDSFLRKNYLDAISNVMNCTKFENNANLCSRRAVISFCINCKRKKINVEKSENKIRFGKKSEKIFSFTYYLQLTPPKHAFVFCVCVTNILSQQKNKLIDCVYRHGMRNDEEKNMRIVCTFSPSKPNRIMRALHRIILSKRIINSAHCHIKAIDSLFVDVIPHIRTNI